jgi:hypothetical protein
MTFSTDICPLCNHKLQFDFVSQGNKVITNYFCPRNPKTVKSRDSWGAIVMVDVFHYTNRIWQDGRIAEVMLEPYLLKHCTPLNRTRIVYLPEGEDPPEFIAEVPLLTLDYSKPQDIIHKIKTLVLFS